MLAPVATFITACSKKPARQETPTAGSLRIDNVTVVDPSDGSERPGMSILIDKGQIVSAAVARYANGGRGHHG